MRKMISRLLASNTLKDTSLAIVSGVLLTLAFPRFDLWFFAWISLIPLFFSLKGKTLGSAFVLSFITGITFLMGVFNWINDVIGFTTLDFIVGGIYWASYYGLFGVLFCLLSKKCKLPVVLSAPTAWVSIEYLRSHFFALNFPLGLLGHSQYLNLPIIQVASLAGVYGISFLVVMANASLAEALQTRKATFLFLLMPGLLLILVLFYGLYVLSIPVDGEHIRVTVIQGNLSNEVRESARFRDANLAVHVKLTRQALPEKPSLIVWPEVAAQGSLEKDLYLRQTITALARETNSFMIVGSAERRKYGDKQLRQQKYFNSAFLISPDGLLKGQYNKMILFPFSEYVPYKELIPWPSRYYSKTAPFIAGNEQTIFDLGFAKLAVTICWENMVAEFFRLFVKNGANFVVNLTNESVFGERGAPYMFLAISVFRAVENRTSIARSAYTGISAFIDPFGRILGVVTKNGKFTFIEGQLTRDMPLSRVKTFYTLHGDVFAYLNLAFCGLSLVLTVFRNWVTNRVPAHGQI